MDCVNHTGVNATAFCQSCGKPLCATCVRNEPGGQLLCETCQASWHSYRQPFVSAPPGMPHPSVAAALGVIPGVGAMYNGQFVKGLIHVVIFAVLVSAAHVYGIFGLFIAAWIAYQVFEAYHTAKARRDGLPLPDPLGLNEVGSWIGGPRAHYPGHPGTPTGMPGANPAAGTAPGETAQNPYTGTASQGSAYQQAPYQQPPYQSPYGQQPYSPPYQPYTPPGAGVPPIPPVPPVGWRRREPIGAIVLIGLGVLFLLGQFDIFSGKLFDYAWPLLLIGLGVWLFVRRLEETKGNQQ
jgi:TM2 domain-containing membrane protein YozV